MSRVPKIAVVEVPRRGPVAPGGWPGDPADATTPSALIPETWPGWPPRPAPCRARRPHHGLPRLPAAGGLAGDGGRRAPRGLPGRAVLGPARCRPGDRRTPASCCRRARPGRARRATGPAASSPATAAATSSSPRCTGPGWPRMPTSTRARRRAAADRHPRRRAGALRAAGEQADPGRAGRLPPVAGPRPRAARADRCGSSSRSAATRGSRCGRRSPRPATPGCRPVARCSGTAPRSSTGRGCSVLGCYHPSQQNTFTGRLTPAMVDDVLQRAAAHARAVA